MEKTGKTKKPEREKAFAVTIREGFGARKSSTFSIPAKDRPLAETARLVSEALMAAGLTAKPKAKTGKKEAK